MVDLLDPYWYSHRRYWYWLLLVAGACSWVDNWCMGHEFQGGGTSASSPTFAGVVAMLNGRSSLLELFICRHRSTVLAFTLLCIFSFATDLRLQKGNPPLGFLNPFLYKNSAAFNDMTAGDTCGNWTKGCNCTADESWTRGFPAVKGWDPSSGLGTPDYLKLKAAVLALPGGTSRAVDA